MSTRIAACALAAALLTAAAPPASAGGAPVFTQDEISIIRDYYSEHPAGPPAKGGKQKSKPLPPGIAKNLARGKPLPPGIAKQQLPTDLLRELPPVPKGYDRVVVDGQVLLVDVATQVIADVIEGAIWR